MQNNNLQIIENQTAKILPFRVKSFKIRAEEFEKILDHLTTSAHIIGADAPLDWEAREYANRQIWDAISAMKEIRAQGEMRI